MTVYIIQHIIILVYNKNMYDGQLISPSSIHPSNEKHSDDLCYMAYVNNVLA